MLLRFVFAVTVGSLAASTRIQPDWPQCRGPGGQGHAGAARTRRVASRWRPRPDPGADHLKCRFIPIKKRRAYILDLSDSNFSL